MLAFLLDVLVRVAKAVLYLLALPLRPFLPPRGRSALPPPPLRNSVSPPALPSSSLTEAPQVPDSGLAPMAAILIAWLARHLRQDPAAGDPPAQLPESWRQWAANLRHEEMARAVAAGYGALQRHLTGVSAIPALRAVSPRAELEAHAVSWATAPEEIEMTAHPGGPG